MVPQPQHRCANVHVPHIWDARATADSSNRRQPDVVDCRAAACVDAAVVPPHSLLLFSSLQQQHQLLLIHLQLSRTIPQLCSRWLVGGTGREIRKISWKVWSAVLSFAFCYKQGNTGGNQRKLHATILQNGRKRKKIKLKIICRILLFLRGTERKLRKLSRHQPGSSTLHNGNPNSFLV